MWGNSCETLNCEGLDCLGLHRFSVVSIYLFFLKTASSKSKKAFDQFSSGHWRLWLPNPRQRFWYKSICKRRTHRIMWSGCLLGIVVANDSENHERVACHMGHEQLWIRCVTKWSAHANTSLTAVWCMDSFHSFHGPVALPSACRWASAWPAQTFRPWVDGSSSRNGSPLSRLKSGVLALPPKQPAPWVTIYLRLSCACLRVVVFPARPRPTKQRRTTGNGAAPSFCFSTASFRKRSSSSGETCRSAALLEQDRSVAQKANRLSVLLEKKGIVTSIYTNNPQRSSISSEPPQFWGRMKQCPMNCWRVER